MDTPIDEVPFPNKIPAVVKISVLVQSIGEQENVCYCRVFYHKVSLAMSLFALVQVLTNTNAKHEINITLLLAHFVDNYCNDIIPPQSFQQTKPLIGRVF